jgi:glycerol transport system substrate-binding protein
VPDYLKLAQLWWQNLSLAVTGEKTPQAAMDGLAEQMDSVLARLQRTGMTNCPPTLNEPKDPKVWLDAPGAPRPKLANEKPTGEAVPYEQLLQAWKEGRVK